MTTLTCSQDGEQLTRKSHCSHLLQAEKRSPERKRSLFALHVEIIDVNTTVEMFYTHTSLAASEVIFFGQR